MLKSKSFELQIYGSNIVYMYSDNLQEVINKLKKDFVEDREINYAIKGGFQGVTLCTISNNIKYHYVIIMKNKDKYEDIDTIAHEIFHLVNNILHSKTIRYNQKNEETYAYLTGYLNKEFFKFKDSK